MALLQRLFRFVMASLFNRNKSPLIIGVCVGIAFSLISTPFLQLGCVSHSDQPSDIMRLNTGNKRDIKSNNIGDLEEDFEPNLNLNEDIEINKNGAEGKHESKLIRSRYYSTELGMKDKVLVSVISTKETISSFGVAINKTLNHYVNKLVFFLDGTGSKRFDLNIPIIGFKEEKPLIKMFRVLSYIYQYYFEDYSYFLFITDRSYINGRRLMEMLDQISISQNVHMGILQDEKDSLYCNLDSGIILSQSILEAVAKELLWCTKHSFSDLDSDNFGRCILHASNLPCKSIFQDQSYQSYALQDEGNFLHESNGQQSASRSKAVTVHNLNDALDIYRLHVYYLQEFILDTKQDIFTLRDKIGDTLKASSLNISVTWPVGSPASYRAPTRFDVISWETFNESHIFMPNDFENLRPLSGVDLLDIVSVIDAGVSHLQALSTGGALVFQGLQYGHRRYDPTRGMDYRVSLIFTDAKENIITKRIEAHRGLTQPEILPMPYVTEGTRVNMLLFLQTSDVADALTFMNKVMNRVRVEQITLTFYLMYHTGESYIAKDDPYKILKDVLKSFSKTYYKANSRATFVHVVIPDKRPSNFALIDLALKKFPSDSLIFVADATAAFDTDFVNRVRMNTIKNWQVFSPIPFALYHPDLVDNFNSYQKMEVKSQNGHYDRFSFDQISFYVEDYTQARKSISRRVPLIRSEKDLSRDRHEYDITVYGMFLSASNLHVLRGVEPSLIMSYVPVVCPATSVLNSTENMFCEKRQSMSLGQRSSLSKLVFEFKEAIDKVKKN